MIHIIVAIDRHGAIGKNGDLLFHIREDLRRFKALTTGNTLIMGRRTFESLPGGALPKRRNIVVTRSDTFAAEGIETARTPTEALTMAAAGPGDTFVIGGGQIYDALLPHADILDLTIADREDPDADTFFPPLNLDNYRVAAIEPGDGYRFVTLRRKYDAPEDNFGARNDKMQ